MRISVVTVTLSCDSGWELTRHSVASQTHADVDNVVVCASGPLPAPSPGLRAFRAEPRGVYNAINEGLARADGDVVGLLHGGDTFASADVLACVAREFADHPELDYIYGDIRYVSGPSRRPGRVAAGRALSRAGLLAGDYPPHPTLYLRAGPLRRLGPYSEAYRICGDLDMWIRIHAAGLKGRRLPAVMVEMTTGGLSTRLGARLWTNNVEKLRVLRANGLPANPLRLLKKYVGVMHDLISRWKKKKTL